MDPNPTPDATRLRMGVPGLDDILGGGLPRDRVYLLEGNPGTGKTTVALQFLLEGVRNGERGLYVTLSETREELAAVAESHGWSLDGITLCDLAIPDEATVEDSQYTMFHPSEVELNETTKSVLDTVEATKPARVVFDSLSELRLLARDSLRYRRQILSLKQFFVGRKSTVLLLDDHTSETSDRQLESLAHGVISLENSSPIYGSQRRRLQVLKLRGVKFLGGYHDFNIETGGVVVFRRLVSAEHPRVPSAQVLSSGIRQLDDMLGGGIDAGTATLLMGPAGAGKSTIATQFASAAAGRGERVAFYAFDEGLRTLYTRANALGMNLDAHTSAGHFTARQIDPAEMTPGEFASGVVDAVDRDGASLIVIDSLNGYMNAMPEERFLTVHLHELLSFLNQRGVATILVMAQHGMMGASMVAPVDISYLADTVLLLRYFEAEGEIRQAISVLKKRSGDHERAIRELRLGDGIRVGEKLVNFRGVLTGVPNYAGPGAMLRDDERGNG
jgi:circadian clock protein KaiC